MCTLFIILYQVMILNFVQELSQLMTYVLILVVDIKLYFIGQQVKCLIVVFVLLREAIKVFVLVKLFVMQNNVIKVLIIDVDSVIVCID